jgi:hypothetical protein
VVQQELHPQQALDRVDSPRRLVLPQLDQTPLQLTPDHARGLLVPLLLLGGQDPSGVGFRRFPPQALDFGFRRDWGLQCFPVFPLKGLIPFIFGR